MLNLTREQTIIEHRKMWNWLADQYEAGRYVEKPDYFRENNYNNRIPSSHCFCCEYVRNTKEDCDSCPIKWSKNPKSPNDSCVNGRGALYAKYMRLICFENCDFKKLSKIAREIANLPEKRKEEKI